MLGFLWLATQIAQTMYLDLIISREIGQATMAIVKGDTCHADVMEIKVTTAYTVTMVTTYTCNA